VGDTKNAFKVNTRFLQVWFFVNTFITFKISVVASPLCCVLSVIHAWIKIQCMYVGAQ